MVGTWSRPAAGSTVSKEEGRRRGGQVQSRGWLDQATCMRLCICRQTDAAGIVCIYK